MLIFNKADIPTNRLNQEILVIVSPQETVSISAVTIGMSSLEACRGRVKRNSLKKNISGEGLLLNRFLKINSLSSGKNDKKERPAIAQLRSETSAALQEAHHLAVKAGNSYPTAYLP